MKDLSLKTALIYSKRLYIILKSTIMENETFISCLAWIHRGYAARVPIEAQMDPEDMQRMKEDPMISEELSKQEQEGSAVMMDEEEQDLPMFSENIAELQSGGKYPNAIDDFEDEEKEDYFIKDTDALIVAGKIEKEHSSLEIYVYEQETNSLFVHHEIMLSSFPLSIQWLNTGLGSIGSNNEEKGNYAIVSTFLPQIEIWNLDIAEAVEPDLILGGQLVSNKKKPKKFTNQAKKWKEGSHTDSVISLSLNGEHKNILASGSADCTVKIWDLAQAKNIYTANHHKSKVQRVKWSPTDVSVIFATSEDGKISVMDSRFPNDRLFHKIANNETIESACWNVNQPTQIVYVTEQGNLHITDVRSLDHILVSSPIHQGSSVTDVKVGKKNLCYTCSEDESVRVWKLQDLSAPIGYKKPKCGKMYCLDLFETADGPILSCGNGKGELFIWDVTENQQIDTYWKSN